MSGSFGKGPTNLQVSQAKGTSSYFVKDDSQISMTPESYMFAPRKWNTQVNNVEENINFTTTTPTYGYNGTEMVIELDKRATYLGRMELIWQRGVLTVSTPGTYARFNDWECYSSIDRIEFDYMNKIVHTVRGEQLYWEMIRTRDPLYVSDMAYLGRGFLSESARNNLATGPEAANPGIWVVADLLVPWEQVRKMIPIVTLPNRIRIRIYFNNLNNCCVTDGSGTFACTINNLYLRCQAQHVGGTIQTQLNNQMMSIGESMLCKSYQTQLREVVTLTSTVAAAQTISIKLRNITNYTWELFFIMRPVNAVTQSGASNTLDLWGSNIIPGQWWLSEGDTTNQITNVYQGSGTIAAPGLDVNKLSFVTENRLAHPLNTHMAIPAIYFTQNTYYNKTTEPSENDCYGGRQLIKYNNLQLNLYFPAGSNAFTVNGQQGADGAGQYYVDIYGLFHNTLMYIKGDWRKFLL